MNPRFQKTEMEVYFEEEHNLLSVLLLSSLNWSEFVSSQADEVLNIKREYSRGSGARFSKCDQPEVEFSPEMSPPAKQFKPSPPEGKPFKIPPPGLDARGKSEGKFKCPFCTKRYRFRQSLKVSGHSYLSDQCRLVGNCLLGILGGVNKCVRCTKTSAGTEHSLRECFQF